MTLIREKLIRFKNVRYSRLEHLSSTYVKFFVEIIRPDVSKGQLF